MIIDFDTGANIVSKLFLSMKSYCWNTGFAAVAATSVDDWCTI